MSAALPAEADDGAADPGLARPWLAAYPPDVPAEIDLARLGTLVDMFDRAVRTYADRPALISFGSSISFRELGASAQAVAGWLAGQGFAKGDRVALMMPNVAAYPAALLGTLVAGCTVVNVNPLYTPRELSGQINDAGARILFVLENFAHTVAAALPAMPGLERVVLVGPGDGLGLKGTVIGLAARYIKRAVPSYALPQSTTRFKAVIEAGRKLPRPKVAIGPDDIAFLQYTGGTTGTAKAAMLTHRNIAANVEQSRAWLRCSGEDAQERVMVTALPLYHIFALTACLFVFLEIGGCCLLIVNPRDCDAFVKTLASTRFTHLSGVNTLFNLLLNHKDIGKVDFGQGEGFHIAGGMAVQAAVAAKWKAQTGKVLIEGYGLSETSPVVTINRVDLNEWSGTIGYPVPSTQVSIRDADGCVLPYGEPGELCVRGPQVMAGYWNRPEETAAATTADGFFRTGDVARMAPDGQIRIVDRMKDMILVSGFNVYPNEVEGVLAAHPAVLECAVVGAPHADYGEEVVAHVVLKDASLAPDALKAHARAQLTGYKVPRRVVVHDSLPKTNVGKVLRRALRDHDSAAG